MQNGVFAGGGVLMPKTSPAEPARTSSCAWRLALAIVAALYAGGVAAIGLVLHRADFAIVHTFDKHVGDWRIALGSPLAAAQRSDIAIVLITEETLLDYESRSPIDRALVGELVRAIDSAGPKAIGVDLISTGAPATMRVCSRHSGRRRHVSFSGAWTRVSRTFRRRALRSRLSS